MGETTGKKRITTEEAERYFKEGYRARVKKTKNYRYIAMNKDGKDLMLGKYSDELWERVRPFTSERSRDALRRRESAEMETLRDELHAGLRRYLKLFKVVNCVFRGEDYYCSRWRWSELPPDIQRFVDVVDGVTRLNEDKVTGSRYWTIRCGPLCGECPSYLDKVMIHMISREIKKK